MGQQQLLLIVLGLIIVAIAVAISISLFRQAAIDSKRDTITNECMSLSTMAVEYYSRAKPLGGGGKSFSGWEIPSSLSTTASGHYSAKVLSDSVVTITGTGNEVVTGNDSVKVEVTVSPKSFHTTIIN